ncbi:MAG: hypothetical protein ABII80_01235 [bacterium]
MKPQILFEDYAKVEIRVGEIVEASIPEGSEKLLQFTVDFGDEKRTIFSGIKEWYKPEELVGVRTMWVTNIPPKTTPFGESQGMLFACGGEGKPEIIKLGKKIEKGAVFH